MKKQLVAYLLSAQNIQDILDRLDATIYIKKDSLESCKKIIHSNLSKYVTRLTKMPTNEKELIEVIHVLNNKCYDEIVLFIEAHYKGKSIRRADNEVIMTREEYIDFLKNRVTHDKILEALLQPSVLLLLSDMIKESKQMATPETNCEIIDIYQLQELLNRTKVKPIVPKYERANIDLMNLTQTTILEIQARIEELARMVLVNPEMSKEIDEEKADLITALVNYKNPKEIEIIDNIQHLDLQLTPRNIDDLNNIIIKVNSEKKIVCIKLLDYYVPRCDNNVTELSNSFTVYHGGNVNQFFIPSGMYSVEEIAKIINDRFSFLEVTVDSEGYVTIANTMKAKYDLMIQNNNIFKMLGFDDSGYRNKVSYKGSRPCSLEANEKAFVSLARSSTQPIELVLDKKITLEEPIILRATSKPMTMKDIGIRITDDLENLYDLVGKQFSLHIIVEYSK